MGEESGIRRERKPKSQPQGGLMLMRVPLPPERKIAWRAGMSEIYACFEEACAKEQVMNHQEEAL